MVTNIVPWILLVLAVGKY